MNVTTEERQIYDSFEQIGRSEIHHGKGNNRIYLYKLERDDVPGIIPELDRLAKEKGYSKIITKIHADLLPVFQINGYTSEAYIPRFFNGKTDCIMVSKFTEEKRKKIPTGLMDTFFSLFSKDCNNSVQPLVSDFQIKKLEESDAIAATELFKQVFETYPFPVYDPQYIIQTMRNRTAIYFGVYEENRLIGISTAETDFDKENAEMTDFAVLPEFRGNKLAYHLLSHMEAEIKMEGIKTVYTIARLAEPGMNLTFMRSGYKFSGTLINNTNIGGSIESMNVFYKFL